MSSKSDGEYEPKGVVKPDEKQLSDRGSPNPNCQNYNEIEITEVGPLSEQVFSIPLILKKILNYLEAEDLLSTSLVNKRYNFFSREILRQNKQCLVIFKENNCACHNLKQLNSLLMNSETIPFNGIFMKTIWRGSLDQCQVDTDLMHELLEKISKKINIKYVSLDLFGQSHLLENQCDRKVFQEIILKIGNSLEGLTFYNTERFDQWLSDIVYGSDKLDQILSNLRILEFPFELQCEELPERLFRELVESSPKLEKLYGKITTEHLEFIVPLNLSKTVKEFYFYPQIDSLRNTLAFALKNPELEKFWFTLCDNDDDTYLFVWEEPTQNDVATILRQLLNSSKESLTKIAFRHADLILATHQWDIPVLKNVNHLSLIYCKTLDDVENFTTTLTKVDWEKYFPNLKEVSVSSTQARDIVEYADFYINDDFLKSEVECVCKTVTKFSFAGVWWAGLPSSKTIQLFKSIFPNVKEFYLRRCKEFEPYFKELWTAWTDLEGIYMSVEIGPWCGNYDFCLLGISEEEATYLLANVEELESLEIVARESSIFNLPKLKKFVIHLIHGNEPCALPVPNPETFFLSRLAGQCAFSRFPGLEVEICRDTCLKNTDNCSLCINQLEPFARFVKCKIDDLGVSF